MGSPASLGVDLGEATVAKSERTQQIDKQIMKHWLPILGPMKLADIKQMHCVGGLNERRKAFAANPGRKEKKIITEGTVQRERRLLHAMFERAVENDLIEKNPWKGIEAPRDKTRAHRVLTVEDEPKLYKAAHEAVVDATGRRMRTHKRYVRFIRFMLLTGLRIDELLNEHFKDKDKETLVRVRGKGDKEREVALVAEARKILDEQWADDDRPASEKNPWWQNEQRFRAVMAKLCERAGVVHLSPHDLRHTFGHRYLTIHSGDIYVLSKILGHASVAVTERHYGYLKQSDVNVKMLETMDPQAAKRRGLRAVK